VQEGCESASPAMGKGSFSGGKSLHPYFQACLKRPLGRGANSLGQGGGVEGRIKGRSAGGGC